VPTRRFAIDRGGAKRLTVSWGRGGRDLRVLLDSFELVPTAFGGKDFRLPDGRTLMVDVDSANGTVDVICDGAFLPGTRFDPEHQLFLAYVMLFLLAAAHVALPFLPIDSWLPDAEGLPLGAAGLALAAFYGLAGAAVARRSRIGLYLATSAVTLEGGLLASVLFLAGFEHVKLLLVLFLPLAPLLTGISALDALQHQDQPMTRIG
jgi:hypothetical protein